MATKTILEKNYTVSEEGGIIIVEKVEKKLSKEELMAEKQSYILKQQQLVRQMNIIKEQYDELEAAIQEISEMIDSIPEITL